MKQTKEVPPSLPQDQQEGVDDDEWVRLHLQGEETATPGGRGVMGEIASPGGRGSFGEIASPGKVHLGGPAQLAARPSLEIQSHPWTRKCNLALCVADDK